MKKYLCLLVMILLLVGCSKEDVKETGRKACCVDSGGVWKNNGCVAPKLSDEIFNEDDYVECLESLNIDVDKKPNKKACCKDAGGYWSNNKCEIPLGGNLDLDEYENCIKY